MATKGKQVIAMSAPVTIAAGEVEGDKKGPAKFNVLAYTGGILPGALRNGDEHEDVILDLAGMQTGKSLVANLDHQTPQRVGHVNAIGNDGKQLNLAGVASAATAARNEVVNSAAEGFVWQASIEANPTKVEQVKPGTTVKVNGQEFEAPARGRALYVARTSVLKGFAFVSHGADDNTTVAIAASAASIKEKNMKAEVKAWAESMGIDIDSATPEALATIEANYEGRQPAKPKTRIKLEDGIEAKQAEADRVDGITEIALNACDKRPYDIKAIKEMAQSAIDAKWTVEKFRLELLEASLPPAHTVFRTRRDERLSSRVIEAAICQSGRFGQTYDANGKQVSRLEDHFTDQELQAAHDKFRGGIGLKQLFLMAASANGYHADYASDVTLEVQRAAFGLQGPRQIQAQGWSTIEISSIISNTANKFLREGWDAVDMTPLRISYIRPVRNFQQITTVSLTGDLQFEKLGAAGEIKHGELGEVVYTNKADTYAKMLAITRQDIINDDLGALTAVPRRLGRGAALKLNDIFWTAFLGGVSANFFGTANSNINEGVATMTSGGLTATDVIFMNQTDPDGKPLGIMPAIIIVPTALKTAALALMTSEKIKGDADEPDGNVWRGRFRVESSPYISNASYTGNTTTGWWMIANPAELPVIEIVALNGRVEPVIDTADADFNVLGVQMRGYSDVGVSRQEYRAGVYADGGSS